MATPLPVKSETGIELDSRKFLEESPAGPRQIGDVRMSTGFTPLKLEKAQFEKIRELVFQLSGINLTPSKQELVKTRLTKRLRALGLGSFDAYLEYLRRDPPDGELVAMIDVITTNKTSFLREPKHFDYLCRRILPGPQKPKGPNLERGLFLRRRTLLHGHPAQ